MTCRHCGAPTSNGDALCGDTCRRAHHASRAGREVNRETLSYVRGYALADDERRHERRMWVAIVLACVVAAYSAGRYLATPRCASCPPGPAYRVPRPGGTAPVTPGNLTPPRGPVE